MLRRNNVRADYEPDFDSGCGGDSCGWREYDVIDFRRWAFRCVCFDSATNLIPGIGPVQQVYLYDTCGSLTTVGTTALRALSLCLRLTARRLRTRLRKIRVSTGAAARALAPRGNSWLLRRKRQTLRRTWRLASRMSTFVTPAHLQSEPRRPARLERQSRANKEALRHCLRMATASCHRSAAMGTA